ncbi:MAG: aminopeptidase [Tissierellia bacterium]|nr:aminopeptidase [Tissierellia bacterium]
MKDFELKLENFAKLAVEFGVNVQKGEDLIINSPIEEPSLARKIAKAAYEKGANDVIINWSDDYLTRLDYKYKSQETLNNVYEHIIKKNEYFYEKRLANRISIYSEDPDLLNGLDQKKIAESIRERSKKMKKFTKYTMNDLVSWLVISIPTKKWAMKVFPDLDENEAVEKLWDEIFKTSRIDTSYQKTLENWQNHVNTLNEKADFLNSHQFDKVHYKSENGTDLVVELPKNHIWMSADSKNSKGDKFVPNIPTEEVFTAPKKTGVNGRLVAVKPLVYNGVVIDEFEFEFKEGKVIDFKAKKGEETLKEMLDSDEGAKYLGEIALVPYDSPISLSNVLFFNTLFDENASCHFALGKAYPTCVKGASELSDQQLNSVGLNDSLIHEDFMVGAKDLEIIGYKDDKAYPIFKDGNWA